MHSNPVDHPVLEAIAGRWSPYRFVPRAIEPEKLVQCFEAARWAASSFNDQPWSWIIALRQDQDQFDRMIGCLGEANQVWARQSGALVLSVMRTTFDYNGKPNRVALHDLGQAAAHLALQATALGLQVHQMAGVDLDAIRDAYQIPADHQPQTAIAIGYHDASEPSDPDQRDLQQRESGPRRRKPLADQVFGGAWRQPADFLP